MRKLTIIKNNDLFETLARQESDSATIKATTDGTDFDKLYIDVSRPLSARADVLLNGTLMGPEMKAKLIRALNNTSGLVMVCKKEEEDIEVFQSN